MKIRAAALCSLLFFLSGFLSGEARRTEPVSIYLILDGSSMEKNALDDALRWIGASVIDQILQEGDDISLWFPGGGSAPVFFEAPGEAGRKDRIKELLRSAVSPGERTDYAGALRAAASRAAERGGLSYTLLITGAAAGGGRGNAAREQDAAELLRYSRMLEFPGWRAQVVGLGITSRVRAAASAYMSGAGPAR